MTFNIRWSDVSGVRVEGSGSKRKEKGIMSVVRFEGILNK